MSSLEEIKDKNDALSGFDFCFTCIESFPNQLNAKWEIPFAVMFNQKKVTEDIRFLVEQTKMSHFNFGFIDLSSIWELFIPLLEG